MTGDLVSLPADHLVRVVVAWLLTYATHSTLLLGGVWLAARRRSLPDALQDTLWKSALVGGLATATFQLAAGWRPLAHVELETGVRAAAESTLPERAARPAAPPGGVTDPGAALPPRAGVGGEVAPAPVPSGVGAWPAALPPFRWEAAVLGIWIAGAAFGLLGYGAARRRMARVLGDRHEIAEGDLPALLARLRSATSVHRPVRLTCSGRVSTPVALGAGEICVPPDALSRLTPGQQETMLAHELAHLVRGDPRWLLFLGLLERVFFFQPLNSVGRRRFQEVSEFLCDDWAVRATGSGVTLARCLAAVAGWAAEGRAPRPLPLAGMAESGSPFVRRVQRLLDGSRGSPAFQAPLRRALVAGGVVAGVSLLAPGVFAAVGADADRARDVAAPAATGAGADAGAAPSAPRAGLRAPAAPVPVAPREAPAAASPPAPTAPPTVEGPAALLPQQGLCWRPGEPTGRAEFDVDGEETRVSWARGDCRVRFESRGRLEFTPDETDLRSLAPAGLLILEETHAGRQRRVEIRPGAGGALQRSWSVDGEARPFDAGARSWLASAIPEVIRFAGLNAESRSRAILRRGGVAGMLDEIPRLYDDAARAAYYEVLLREATLTPELWRRVLRGIGGDVRFDVAKQTLLMSVVRRPLEEPALLAELLAAAAAIGHDPLLSRLLAAVAGRYPLDRAAQEAYLRAARTVGHDPERRIALAALAGSGRLDPALLDELLLSAADILGDADLAALLVEVARKYPLAEDAREAYLRAAATLESESLRQRVHAALPGRTGG